MINDRSQTGRITNFEEHLCLRNVPLVEYEKMLKKLAGRSNKEGINLK